MHPTRPGLPLSSPLSYYPPPYINPHQPPSYPPTKNQNTFKERMSPSLSSTLNNCSSSPVPATTTLLVSKCNIYPHQKSTLHDLKLSVSDLPMLSCHYIQKGLFFPSPQIPIHLLLPLLQSSLSHSLSFFPPLAGRLTTHPDGTVYIACNDAGVEFSHAVAPSLSLSLLLPDSSADDVPHPVKSLFVMDCTVSFQGHFRPLAAFQFTELGDGAVFIGCTINHAIVDGTSFWNFFNGWAELCRSGNPISVGKLSRSPDFRRNFFGESKAVIKFPDVKGPEVTFNANAPLRERIFHFSRVAILQLKSRANFRSKKAVADENAEIYGKLIHDTKNDDDISSFQSLCAQLWISVTRARKYLNPEANTTFRMAINCRHRVSPRVDPLYFGNAIQSIPTIAKVGEVIANDVSWAANLLHRGVTAHSEEKVKQGVADWEAAPRCFPLGNPDGAGVTMGSSPRFPMYDGNDFGWGPPVAVRSGKANKFDGKISAFPARGGGGAVDLEVCLAPETMAALIKDDDFMCNVSSFPL